MQIFTAMEICRLGVGDELFSDLCLTQGELAYRGSYFVYEFSRGQSVQMTLGMRDSCRGFR